MSNYDEIFYAETEQDEMDLAAHEEAHKILTGELPSSPETYAMVQKFYGKADSVEHMEITLTKNATAQIDASDFEMLSRHSWHLTSGGYAASRDTRNNNQHIYMHRLIMNAPSSLQVDHINGNRTDNRRSNLRLCTETQNSANRGKQVNGVSSRYKGVSLDISKGKWIAQITANGMKRQRRFRSENQAAEFYNIHAKELFGAYAVLNEIEAEDHVLSPPMYHLNCEQCGRDYWTAAAFQQYCDRRCREVHQYQKRLLGAESESS